MRIFTKIPKPSNRIALFVLCLAGGTGLFTLFQSPGTRSLIPVGTTLVYFLFLIDKKTLIRLKASLTLLPPEWQHYFKKHSLFYPLLDVQTRKRFENDAKILMAELKIRGELGVDLAWMEDGWETRLFIAMGLATVLIGRPKWELPLPGKIIVLPGKRINGNLESGSGQYAAAATKKAMYLTKENLWQSFCQSEDGYNNIFHEIAHYFDMENGELDGIPRIDRFEEKEIEKRFYPYWEKVMAREFEKIRRGELKLRSYSAKNPGELFACATELFFERPGELKHLSPALYDLLSWFYNFNPLELLGRSTSLPNP